MESVIFQQRPLGAFFDPKAWFTISTKKGIDSIKKASKDPRTSIPNEDIPFDVSIKSLSHKCLFKTRIDNVNNIM
jgi:hypothetical protein